MKDRFEAGIVLGTVGVAVEVVASSVGVHWIDGWKKGVKILKASQIIV